MFGEIWGRLRQEGRIRVRGKESTAFMASSYSLLLSLAVWWSRGVVQDVRHLMANTKLAEDALQNLLEAVAVDIDTVRDAFASAPVYPDTVQNYFQRYPLIRVGDWALFAPLPDLLLQSWDLRNLFEGLECALANLGAQGGVEYYRALGVVFEEYVHDLLREIADSTACRFVEPFPYEVGHESPDGFLVSDASPTLVFEAKCYRVPQRSYTEMELAEFERWFASLLGTNDREREPLRQGASFFEAWAGGNDEAVCRLGTEADQAIYLIVSYEDVPLFACWRVFRRWYQERHLDRSLEALWARTLVISVRDLERLVAAARIVGSDGTGVAELVQRYLEYRDGVPDAHETFGFKDGLGGWLAAELPEMKDSEPRIVAEARDRLFERALELGFGEGQL